MSMFSLTEEATVDGHLKHKDSGNRDGSRGLVLLR